MGDPANTPAHRQQCGDTIIIVMPESKTSGVQFLPQDSCNRLTGRATGMAPTFQLHPTTITSERQRSCQETSQQCAEVQPDPSMLAYRINSLGVDRTALAQRGTSPVEEMSLDASQITSSADGYFSRENIRRVHGLVSATSKSVGQSLHTRQARRHAEQHNGFTTPPPTLPQTKLDFSEDEGTNSMDASDSCYFNRKVAGHPCVIAVSAGGNVAVSNCGPSPNTASLMTGQCLGLYIISLIFILL